MTRPSRPRKLRVRFNPRAPFFSPEHALEKAYQLESQSVVKVSTFITSMMGRGVVQTRSSSTMTEFDRHAQAAMVLAFVHRQLTAVERIIVQAHYTVPTEDYLERRKRNDAMLLINMVREMSPRPDIHDDYVIDCIREWCGYKRLLADKTWAGKLHVDETTLRYWRHGHRARKWDGFIKPFSLILGGVGQKLADPMFEAGLTKT